MNTKLAHAKVRLQQLTRQIADELDAEVFDSSEEQAIVAAVDAIAMTQPVSSGRARTALTELLLTFAEVYLTECPDARMAPQGPCATCGAADTYRWIDHALLDYGHTYAYVLSQRTDVPLTTLFPAPSLQPRLTR